MKSETKVRKRRGWGLGLGVGLGLAFCSLARFGRCLPNAVLSPSQHTPTPTNAVLSPSQHPPTPTDTHRHPPTPTNTHQPDMWSHLVSQAGACCSRCLSPGIWLTSTCALRCCDLQCRTTRRARQPTFFFPPHFLFLFFLAPFQASNIALARHETHIKVKRDTIKDMSRTKSVRHTMTMPVWNAHVDVAPDHPHGDVPRSTKAAHEHEVLYALPYSPHEPHRFDMWSPRPRFLNLGRIEDNQALETSI